MKSPIKGKTVKSLSNTRWSARLDATTALKENFVELRQLLQDFTLDDWCGSTRFQLFDFRAKRTVVD